jgi:poly(A) polymerase
MELPLKEPIFDIITKVVEEQGVRAFVIGGYVRDLLLGRPSKDIDIVVLGKGIELAESVAKALGCEDNIVVFKNFGTAMIEYDDIQLEFVGARKESYNRYSRKPIVEAGTLEEDQQRRDFTINALAISLNRNDRGHLLDPFKGIADLNNKVLKTPLDAKQTFSDDPLRMLRAIRFATQLDFIIEEKTLKAIYENADRMTIVSQERITEELNKIILAKTPSVGFKLLKNSGLLRFVFPELETMKGIEIVDNIGHKDNFYHTIQVLDNIAQHTDNLWLRWAALLHDIGKPRTKRYVENVGWTFYNHDFVGAKMIPGIFKKMRLPLNDKMRYVQKLVRLHMRPMALVDESVSDSAVRRLLFDAGDVVEDLMLLAEADITSKNKEKVQRYLNNFGLVREKLKIIEEKDKIRQFQPPISGEVIMKTLGIGPSKIVGKIKNAIKDAILDGVIKNDYDEAYQLMLELAKEYGVPVKKD